MSPLVPDRAHDVLVVGTAVGAGVAGGVYFAFSTFVMKALDRLPAPRGLSAMQSINRAAPSPAFMTALLGTGLTALVVSVSTMSRPGQASSRYELVGSALYLGSVLLTVAYHVPRNDALAALEPSDPDAAGSWHDYVSAWTRWNHLRTGAAIAAAVLLTIASRVGADQGG
jgi:uncharacterized membrane protein